MDEHADQPAATSARQPATSMHSAPSGVAPNGHSYVLAINEYCQRHFRTDVRYVFARCDPDYTATAVLDGLTYSTGRDPNKHVAKILAAKSTAEVLLPEMRDVGADSRLPDDYKLAIFDNVDLADERIPEITMPYDVARPYNLLLRCLDRNFGYKECDITLTTHRPESEYCRAHLSLTVGSYSVSVPMTSRAKQEASQTILMNVHPHLESWGSLVRMYVVNTARTFEDMTSLAGIQHNLVMLALDADADDGVPPGEDKGEPRTAFRGLDDESEVSGDDSDDDEEDGDGDDEDEDDEDEEDEVESDDDDDARLRHHCGDRCVVVELGDLVEEDEEEADDDEGDKDPEEAKEGGKQDRDVNFNLEAPRCGAAAAADRPNMSFCGRLSFGDLPTIGDDFEAALLEPLRATTAARTPTTTSARTPTTTAAAQRPATSASAEAQQQPVGHGDATPGPRRDVAADATGRGGIPLHRRRQTGPAWFEGDWPAGDVEQGVAAPRGLVGEVQDGPPLMWCDMPSSFADIFKDWPHRHHQDEQQQGKAFSALFGLQVEKGDSAEGE